MTDQVTTLEYANPRSRRPTFKARVRFLWMAFLWFANSLLVLFFVILWIVGSHSDRGHRQQMARAALSPNDSLSQAVSLFNRNMRRPPNSLDELIKIADDDPDRAKWTGPYLNDAEGLNDPWGHPFQYQITGAADDRQYHLWSIGANGIDETSDGDDDFGDDIRNWQ